MRQPLRLPVKAAQLGSSPRLKRNALGERETIAIRHESLQPMIAVLPPIGPGFDATSRHRPMRALCLIKRKEICVLERNMRHL